MATATSQRTAVVGIFEDRYRAQQAVYELERAGFEEDQIGVISHNNNLQDIPDAAADDPLMKDTAGSRAAEGAAAGVVAGSGIGALWAIGVAAGFLPAIGPVIAGGILAAVLASAAGGAAVAGLIGALVGLGIPPEEAEYYEEKLRGGRTLVTVKCESRIDEAEEILRRHGGYGIQASQVASAPATTATSPAIHWPGEPLSSAHPTWGSGITEDALAPSTGSGSMASASTDSGVNARDRKPASFAEDELSRATWEDEAVLHTAFERNPGQDQAASSDVNPNQRLQVPVKNQDFDATTTPKVPDATAPDATAPDATAPDATAPDATAPSRSPQKRKRASTTRENKSVSDQPARE